MKIFPPDFLGSLFYIDYGTALRKKCDGREKQSEEISANSVFFINSIENDNAM